MAEMTLYPIITGIMMLACLGVAWHHVVTLRRARRLLEKAKQEMRDMAQLPLGNPHPIIQITQSGTITFINQSAQDVFEDIDGVGANHPVLCGFVEQDRDIVVDEIRYGTRDYQRVVSRFSDYQEMSFIIYYHDITDRKAYEVELKESRIIAEFARIEAEKANKARGDFLANISHELRTPMNGIIGLSDLLARENLQKENQEMVVAIHDSACNLLKIMNDLLDFSKIESGEITLEYIPFDMRDLLERTLRLHYPVADEKGLKLDKNIVDDIPKLVMGDPTRLCQILNNLIGNALKFTETGSVSVSIEAITSAEVNGMMQICVTDTGIGIADDKKEVVFQKFQQADTSTTRRYGGTGLGLSITKDLVALMGGHIVLDSLVGRGTSIRVSIPLVPVDEEIEVMAADESALLPGVCLNTALTVLIVDDHPVNLLYMQKMLDQIGFANIMQADNGQAALSLFSEHNVDLILMDCQMPKMSGFETAQAIRNVDKSGARPIIIAVTADVTQGMAERCRAVGMDDYIAKPVERLTLTTVLQRWIPGNDFVVVGEKNYSDCSSCVTLDLNYLRQFTCGDQKAEREILEIFMRTLKEDMNGLDQSFEARDYKKWAALAHKIYGSCAHIGATSLASVCEKSHNITERDFENVHCEINDSYQALCRVMRSV